MVLVVVVVVVVVVVKTDFGTIKTGMKVNNNGS